MVKVAQENNYDIIGSPTEVLVKNIHNADSEEEYITEIRLPIIKNVGHSMAKKNEEIDIDEEIKRISRKTNVDFLKSERTFDNRIKNLEKEIEKASQTQIKDFDKVKS